MTSATRSVQYVEIDPDRAGQRLDNFLMARLRSAPRSLVYRIVRKGEVRVNRSRVSPSYRLQAGDSVRIPPVRLEAPQEGGDSALGQRLQRCVLHEDEDLLVLDKPAGVAVHGGTGIAVGVIEALREVHPHWQGLELVHRLDRATSGCLVLARNRRAMAWLNEVFRDHLADKRYLALVAGQWPDDLREIDAPLAREQEVRGERDMVVDEAGKRAVTRFTPVQRFARATLLEVTIVTGRTHQIRAHCAHAGHPLGGDPRYGDVAFNRELRALKCKRMFLHAHRLGLPMPDGEMQTFHAPLDAQLRGLVDHFEGAN